MIDIIHDITGGILNENKELLAEIHAEREKFQEGLKYERRNKHPMDFRRYS